MVFFIVQLIKPTVESNITHTFQILKNEIYILFIFILLHQKVDENDCQLDWSPLGINFNLQQAEPNFEF